MSNPGIQMDTMTDDEDDDDLVSNAGSDLTQRGQQPSGYRSSPDRGSNAGHSHGPSVASAPAPRGAGAGVRRQQYRRGQRPPPPSTPDEILEQQLEHVPGWSKENQGSEIDPRPPRFHLTANSNATDWAPYSVGSDAGCLFTPESAPRFCRYEMVLVMMAYISNDAEYLGDWSTLDDRAQHAQQVACAKLLGMMTMGTSKGLITGSPACLEGLPDQKARDAMMAALEKAGMSREYTFCPDPAQYHAVALQFSWLFEWVYDEAGEKRIAFRVVKAIADPTHSSDELWEKLIRENVEVASAGQTNSRPESQRDNKLKAANKEQRGQCDPDDLERTVEMQYKTIRNLQDLHDVYTCYGGDTGRNDKGWPLFPVPMEDCPAGVAAHQLKPHRRWGGECAIGPSVALNPLRCVENDPEQGSRFHRGPNEMYYCNVALSGLSVGGARVKCYSEQECWADYINPDTKVFEPPQWVVDKKAIFICHKGSIVNIFRARFPSEVAEVTIPDDTLLKMLFELDKEKPANAISLALEMLGPEDDDSFEALRPSVVSHYSHLVMGRQNAGTANVQHAFANGMLTPDTLGLELGEIQRLELRSYDGKDANRDANWVLEPRQCLKDISLEIRRANDIAVDWNTKKMAEIDALPRNTDEEVETICARSAERMQRYSQAVEACIKMGLNRFEHAYSCKRTRATIPIGWVDVAHHGLHDALRKSVELSEKAANAQDRTPRAVRSSNTNASAQCANMAFLYNRQYVTRDVSPMGSWRTYLFTLFSRCASISGPDIRLMLELWTHAFEAFQEVSFILLFCGGAGAQCSFEP